MMFVYADDIKEIEFVLENCEAIIIERKHIGDFFLGKIERQIARYGCNYIGDILIANKFQVEISASANVKQVPSFGGDERFPFERFLAWQDITRIVLVHRDGSEKSFVVNYDEGENEGMLGANNINQKAKMNENGDLYIVIGAGMEIDEVYPNEIINDSDMQEFKWNMYDCEGDEG